jgi:opacity protein-like surface antigen
MSGVKFLALVGAAAFLTTASHAADMPMPYQPPPPPDTSGWYLRGDIGISNQRVGSLNNVLYNTTTVTNLDKGFDGGGIFGLGVGYKVNNWLRFDVTGEYRAPTNFRGLDRYVDPNLPTGFGADDYYGRKTEWVALVNAYVDLGTWWCITPFIGAGIGAANVTIGNFRDVNVPTNGVAYAGEGSKWNFAWAAHAGLAYAVTPGFTIELAYRYLSLGNGQTGDLITYNGVSTINNPMEFHNITSHDVKLGVRWMFAPDVPAYQPPLVRKG